VASQIILNGRGTERAEARFKRMGQNAAHAKPALEEIVTDVLIPTTKERWGKGWRKLADSTKEAKKRKGQPRTKLVASGRLRDSLTKPGHKDMIFDVNHERALYGTRVFYAQFHDKPRDNEPRRRLIRLTKQSRKAIAEKVSAHLRKFDG